jgi:hypothetical protein
MPLLELLESKREFLGRDDAQRIVALGPAVADLLLPLLEGDNVVLVQVAATLLAALGDTRGVDVLGRRLQQDLAREDALELPYHYGTMLAEALASMGAPGLSALETVFCRPDEDYYVRYHAVQGLVVAEAPGADDVLLRLFDVEADPELKTVLGEGLCGRHHPQAEARVGAAMQEDDWCAYDFGPKEFEEWKVHGTLAIRDTWTPRKLGFFLPSHRAEFHRVEEELIFFAEGEKERWTPQEFLEDFLWVRTTTAHYVTDPKPCGCGSGKTEMACCHPWLSRLANPKTVWPWWGYRWSPAEQYNDLPREDFIEAVMLLSATLKELRQGLKRGLRNDYLRWAAALRFQVLGQEAEYFTLARDLALSSAPRHPALEYTYIHKVGRVRSRRLFEEHLAARHLAHAWMWCNLREDGPEATAECLRLVRAAAPDFLWTAAATAEILDVHNAAMVLPVLHDALERARAGRSTGLPGLLEDVCPAWVLEGYVKSMGQSRSLFYVEHYPIAP